MDPWPTGASSLPPRAVGATRRESGSSGVHGSGGAEGVSPGRSPDRENYGGQGLKSRNITGFSYKIPEVSKMSYSNIM